MALYLGNNKVRLNAYSGDYKFKDGKLIWANPDLYIRAKFPYNPQINTGYIPKQNTRAIVKFTFTVFPDWSKKKETLSIISNMGSYNTTKVFSCLVTNNYYEKPSIWWAGKRGGFNTYDIDSFINNHTYRFDISVEETGPQILYDDATNKEIKRVDTNFDFDASSVSKPFLFFENNYGTQQYAKGQTIYYVQLYEDSDLVHNFVPVHKGLQIGDFTVPSNGMFDIVEQKFYANSGSGEFEFGKNSPYIITDGKLIGTSTSTTHLDFSGSQYLQIPYKANNNTKVNIGISTSKQDANQAIICSRTLTNKNSFTMFFVGLEGTRLRSDYDTEQAYVGNYVSNTKYNIVKDKNITYINNTAVNTATETEFTAQTDTYIGASNYVGGFLNNYLYGSVYFCKIYENDVLLYDLVPVYKGLQIGDFTVPSNGMFDMVNQKFYANQGTGELGFSNDIVQNDTSFSKVNVHTMQGDYLIKDGKLLWANPNIYLENADENTAPYINTLYALTGSDTFSVLAQGNKRLTPVNNDTVIGLSERTKPYPSCYLMYHWNNEKDVDLTYGTLHYNGSAPYETPVLFETKISGNVLSYYVNGTKVKDFDVVDFGISDTCYANLFCTAYYSQGVHIGSYYPLYGRIYNCKFYKNGTDLVRNFVPVPAGLQIGSFTVPSNGMFDIVEQKFYENRGTGDFEFGGNQSDYVISDGKLLWANKKLKLYIPGTYGQKNITKISTGVFLDEISGFEYKTATITGEQCNYIGVNNTTDNKYYLSTYGLVRYDDGIHDDFSNNTSFLLYSFRDTPQTKGSLEQYNTNISTVGDGWYSEVKMVGNNTWKFIGTFVEETKDFSGRDIPHYEILLGTTINTVTPDGTTYSNRWVRYYKLFNKDGNLVRYFVPVKKGLTIGTYTTPAVGMFDIVEQKFYGNEGTGEFLINKDE